MWSGTRRNGERVNWLRCVVQENSLFSTLKRMVICKQSRSTTMYNQKRVSTEINPAGALIFDLSFQHYNILVSVYEQRSVGFFYDIPNTNHTHISSFIVLSLF